MQDREQTIAFAMNYCQHYNPLGIHKGCRAGADIKAIQCVVTKPGGLKWGPCIEGHLLPAPLKLCPHWLRTTREQGEAEVVACPVCGGRLHLTQSAYNGHVHGKCSTPDCVNWME